MEKNYKDVGAVLIENGKIIGYETGETDEGFVFKDIDAFINGTGVCYISEGEFEEFMEDLQKLKDSYGMDYIKDPNYRVDAQHLLDNVGWTREKLISLVGGPGFEELALDVLKAVNWQSPETYFNEIDIDEEDLKRYHLTKEQVNKAWGHEYFKIFSKEEFGHTLHNVVTSVTLNPFFRQLRDEFNQCIRGKRYTSDHDSKLMIRAEHAARQAIETVLSEKDQSFTCPNCGATLNAEAYNKGNGGDQFRDEDGNHYQVWSDICPECGQEVYATYRYMGMLTEKEFKKLKHD